MIRYEDDCVGCPPEMGCLGTACPYTNVRRLYCDNCKQEVDKLYELSGVQWCEDCIVEDALSSWREV